MAARFWVGGSGNWNDTAHWSTTTGGASGAAVPTTADAVTFDASSGTGTCTTTSGATCGSLTLNSSTLGVTLGADMVVTGSFTLTLGTFSFASYKLTSGSFSSNNSNARTLAFGTGSMELNAAGGTLWSTTSGTGVNVTGSAIVSVTYSGSNAVAVATGGATEANALNFKFTAGTYTLSFLQFNGYSARDVDFTGFSGSWGLNTTQGPIIYGSLTLSSTMTVTASTTGVLTFAGTSGTKTITCNGKTLDFPVTFNGAGSTWVLQDAFTLVSTRTLTHTNGILDLNGKTLTVGTSYTTAAGTKNLTFNGGTLVCPGTGSTAFNNAAPTNYTTTAGTGTGMISMTGGTAKTFVGGGSNFACVLNQAGAGTLTVSGSNTFLDVQAAYAPSTITLTSGTTTTVANFTLSGTAGNIVTLNSSSSPTKATLSKTTGSVLTSYLSIVDSSATGGASWESQFSTGSNTFGWIIYAGTAPISASVTGLDGVGYTGTAKTGIFVTITNGTEAYAYLASALVWGEVNTDQTPNWIPVV